MTSILISIFYKVYNIAALPSSDDIVVKKRVSCRNIILRPHTEVNVSSSLNGILFTLHRTGSKEAMLSICTQTLEEWGNLQAPLATVAVF